MTWRQPDFISRLSRFFECRRKSEAIREILPKMFSHALRWKRTGAQNKTEMGQLILGMLREKCWLQIKFPRALSEGVDGIFAVWLRNHLPLSQHEQLDQTFANDPTETIIDHFIHDYRWRRTMPQALLPNGRPALMQWLCDGGAKLLHLDAWQVLWFLQRSDEDLVRLQAVTDAVVPSKNPQETINDVQPRIVEAAQPLLFKVLKHRCACSSGSGVNVLGHFTFCSGLQRSALLTANTLVEAGERIALRNIPLLDDRQPNLPGSLFLDGEAYNQSILHITPASFYRKTYERSGLRRREGVYRIGHMAWELPKLPAEWWAPWTWLDEVWVYSEFVAVALRPHFSKVHRVLPGLPTPATAQHSRTHFGLPEGDYLFLMIFDLGSSLERKNPMGAIEAYRRAVRVSDRARLVIKASHYLMFPSEFARLREAALEVNAIILTDHLTEDETNSLINLCDASLSLHRSEGFGFTLAEAMMHARPVIATGWSGNMEFMSCDHSYLANWSPISVGSSCAIYSQASEEIWADPDLDHAAHLIRSVLDHREEATQRGELGRKHVSNLLSVEQSVKSLRAHLDRIRAV